MAPIRFIHTADVHFGASYGSLPPEVAQRRRKDQQGTFTRIIERATNGSPHTDLMLIAGDLFEDATPSPQDIAFVRDALSRASRAGVRPFIIPGNHDEYRPGSFWDRAALGAEHVFRQYGFEARPITELGLTLWGAAMNPARSSERLLSSFPAGAQPGRSILIFHGNYLNYGPDDAPRYLPFDLDDVRNLPVNYVALGHHHGFKEVLSEPRRKAFYPGAPEATGFGSSQLGDRFILCGEIADDGKVAVEPVRINTATHLVETIDCTHVDSEELRKRLEALAAPDRLLRVRLSGVCSPQTAQAAESLEKAMASQFAFLEVRTEITDIAVEPSDNVYLRSFRDEISRRLKDAPPEQQAVLRRCFEIGTIAFSQKAGRSRS